MSKISKLLGRESVPDPRHPNLIQQEYNDLCAKLGQDVVRIEDLQRASQQLIKNVDECKGKIFAILNEMPKAREFHGKKEAEESAKNKPKEVKSNA